MLHSFVTHSNANNHSLRNLFKFGCFFHVSVYLPQALPWLELAALNSEEAERKERVKRLMQQKAAGAGKGFGPMPKLTSKPYVSAYNKSGSVAGTYII